VEELFNNFNKIVLVVEYDGREYYGFQWQANQPTIQAELEQAIQKLTGERSRVTSASRTDTGVHARSQVVTFRTRSALPPGKFVRALNHYLPDDIAVKAAGRVSARFNVMKDAVSREYDYRILNNSNRSPLAVGFVHRVPGKLDIGLMDEACKLLEGEHDFASFASALGTRKNTVRRVFEAGMKVEGGLAHFGIVASSFLPHQVRNTVGLLIRVGKRKVTKEEFKQVIEMKKVGLAGPAAPPCGLYLVKVNYPEDSELKYENLCN
jgi:tRNA pseudouridine38-40 synthase